MSDRQMLLRQFAGQLKSFQTSRNAFTVFTQVTCASSPASTTPSTRQGRHQPKPRALVVLDSSFNPPTLAHMRMAASAVRALRKSSPSPDDIRVLLLLAVNNADKAPDKPVAFPLRMEMMRLFALDLLREIDGGEAGSRSQDDSAGRDDAGIAIDLGLTTMPYFHDKSRAIVDSGHYKDAGKEEKQGAATDDHPEQVILAGYDTLVRIFNPKYYAGSGGIRAALDPFIGGARLRVTMRTDDEWGGREDQLAYLEGLKDGKLDEFGGRGAWCDRVDLVEGDQDAVSSTRVREAARTGNAEALEALVSPSVKDFILEEKLYARYE